MTLGKLLKEEVELFNQRVENLRKIAAIVKQHPEWVEQEPELAELLEKVKVQQQVHPHVDRQA